MPAGREVLKVLEHGGIHPETADDLDAPPAAAISRHGNSCRSGIGDEMLSSARKSGPDHLVCRQQRQDGENDNAAPGADARRCDDEAGRHSGNVADGAASSKSVNGEYSSPRPPVSVYLLNGTNHELICRGCALHDRSQALFAAICCFPEGESGTFNDLVLISSCICRQRAGEPRRALRLRGEFRGSLHYLAGTGSRGAGDAIWRRWSGRGGRRGDAGARRPAPIGASSKTSRPIRPHSSRN